MIAGLVARGISSGTVLRFEGLFIVLGVVIAFWVSRVGSEHFHRVETRFIAFASNRWRAVLVSALIPVALRLMLLPFVPTPVPAIQEEFSYLLEGDTFAAGRLANPPHPMAEFFDTFQVLQRPTYCSIRPPAQGAFLALGDLTGSSWIGVLLSIGAFCAALCWMLQGWVPPGWAFLGAVLAALRIGVLSHWMNSYWGGAVTALGGLLVLGALPRLKKKATLGPAIAMGCGIALIANTRIYEGSFVLIPVALDLVIWIVREHRIVWPSKLRIVLALAVICMSVAAWMSYYNLRTTGKATEAPYVLYTSTYNPAPPFIWQKVELRTFRIPEMKKFYIDWSIPDFERRTGRDTYWRELREKADEFRVFYLRWAFILPLLTIPWLMRKRRLLLIWIILAISIVGAMIEVWGAPYYFAALTGVVYLLIIEGLRVLRGWRTGDRPVGEFMARWVVLTCVVVFALSAGLQIAGIRIKDAGIFFFSPGPNPMQPRALVESRLERMEGQHLVVVRYSETHNPHEEWVWNTSDPDSAKVVWARDLGPEKERELIRYYSGRHVWVVEPDRASDKIRPYSPAAPSS